MSNLFYVIITEESFLLSYLKTLIRNVRRPDHDKFDFLIEYLTEHSIASGQSPTDIFIVVKM